MKAADAILVRPIGSRLAKGSGPFWAVSRGALLPFLLPLFKMDYHDRVKFWIVVGPLWLVALAALFGILILPANLDIYIHDMYIVLAKTHLILSIFLVLVLPLVLLTIWHLRSTNI